MKIKRRLTLLIVALLMTISCLPIFSFKVEAITTSEIKKQVSTTRKHIEQLSGNTTFSGYCGAHVSFQLQSLGITSGFVGKDGKDHYNAYTNQAKSSGGYPILLFPASQSDLGETLNLITKNGTVDAFNILVGFERGSTNDAGQKYGHAVFIHGIIDGKLYFIESYSTYIGGKYYNEGEVISCSISQFVNYYKAECTVFDGIVYFGHPYMKSCTPKNTCGLLKIKDSTSVQTLPCKQSVNSDSENMGTLSVPQEYEYVKEYKNSIGESWYLINYNGGLLFVLSDSVEIISSKTPTYSFSTENIQVNTFYIANDSYYLNMLTDAVGSQTVSVSNSNIGTNHQFKLERINGSLTYKIKSVSSSNDYVLDCRWQNKMYTTNGDEVILNKINDDKDLSQAWSFERCEDGYLIHVAGTPSLVLTREDNAVVVKKNTKASNQIWTLNTEVTCSHEYVYKYGENTHWEECTKCGERGNEISHNFVFVVNDAGEILHTDKVHFYYCSVCKYNGKNEEHVYSSPCDTLCSVCQGRYSEREAPHTYVKKENLMYSWNECSSCGHTTTKEEHHFDFRNDEMNHWLICTKCGYVDSYLQEHNLIYKNIGEKHQLICTSCGYIAYTGEHSFRNRFNENGHWLECVCGEKGSSSESHTFFTNGEDRTYHWKECECGYTCEKERHSFDRGIIIEGDPFEHYESCECGYNNYSREYHNIEYISQGAEGHIMVKCVDCGWTPPVGEELVDHYFKWTDSKAPSCSEEGTRSGKCVWCGYTTTESLPKEEHTYESVTTAPSCSAEGYTTHTCSVCKESYVSDPTNKIPHTPSDWIIDAEPDVGVEGAKHVECQVCHEVLESASIEALPSTEKPTEKSTEKTTDDLSEESFKGSDSTEKNTDDEDDTVNKNNSDDKASDDLAYRIDINGCQSYVSSIGAVIIISAMAMIPSLFRRKKQD